MALVTAVITSYKREAAIVERAIDSIRCQTFSDIEILVVDDNVSGSEFSGDLKELCSRKGAVYLSYGENRGACAARNYGIEHASGKYIGFLDDDDEWMKEKIEIQVRIFEENPDVGLVYGKGNVVNEDTHRIISIYNDNNIINDLSFEKMLAKDYIGSTSMPLIKKECFEKVGGFWEKQPARQDYEMWLRISKEFKVKGTDEILYIHNMHEGEQISRNFKKSFEGYCNILERYKEAYDKYTGSRRSMMKTLCGVCLKGRSPKCVYYGLMYFYLSFKMVFEKK